MTPAHDAATIEAAILEAVAARGTEATVCPSEVARGLDPVGWRALMEPVRAAARVLAQAGRIDITQRGVAVDPRRPWTGPVRLRRVRGAPS